MEKNLLDPRTSLILQAPAGSGKTHRLTRRFVALLEDLVREDPWNAFRVQAITFTRNAAAEMKTRVMESLHREHPELFEQMAWAFPFLRISDFHGAYLRLVERASFLDPDRHPPRDILQGGDLELLKEEAYREWRRRATEQDIQALRRLVALEQGGEKVPSGTDLLQWVEQFWEKRPHTDVAVEVNVPGDALLSEDIRETYEEELKGLKGVRKPEKKARKEELERLLGTHGAWDRFLALREPLHTLYASFRDILQHVKRRHQFMDFADMEAEALRLLEDHERAFELLELYDEATQHLLVDEFQDTNLLNWLFVWRLVEDWFSGETRKTEKGEAFSVFAVGDPRQSIYIFRGANPEIFEKARKVLEEQTRNNPHVRFETRSLVKNYRSAPLIVQTVNTVFRKVYEDLRENFPWLRFEEAEAHRTDEGRVVFHLLPREEGEKIAQDREKTARLVAAEILREHRAGRAFREMAVLFPNRTVLPYLLKAFQERNIPYVQAGGRGFFQTPEVTTLLSVVDALLHPEGQGAWHLRAVRPEWLEALKPWREVLPATPLSEVLAGWVREVAYPAYLDEVGRANLAKFQGLVEAWEARGLSAVEIWQRLFRFAKSREEGQADVVDVDAVQLMTVHAAKGLEFPVVFLVGLERKMVNSGNDRKNVLVEEDLAGERVRVYVNPGDSKHHFAPWVHHRARERLQSVNLLYVAFTRARDVLHVVLPYALTKNGALQGSNTYAGTLLRAMALDPESQTFGLPLPEGVEVRVGAEDPAGEVVHTVTERRRVPPFPVDRVVVQRPAGEEVEHFLESVPHTPSDRTFGEMFHALLQAISLGDVSPEHPEEFFQAWLATSRLSQAVREALLSRGLEAFARMKDHPKFAEWVLPRDNAYAEWPFALRVGDTLVTGRVDRLLVEPNRVVVVDYKTFDVPESAWDRLREAFREVLSFYAEAARRAFDRPRAEAYLWLVPSGALVEVPVEEVEGKPE